MELTRTMEKVEDGKVTIRTETLSVDTANVDDFKQFVEGRKAQMTKMDQEYNMLKDDLAKINEKALDEEAVLKFEAENKNMLKQLGMVARKNQIKYKLQGLEIEREKFQKDVVRLQEILKEIEAKGQ